MKRLCWLLGIGLLIGTGSLRAEASKELAGWQRIDSKYCTLWIHPELELGKINRKVSTWRVRPRVKAEREDTPASELAAKCDTLFRKAQEILDMYPPGVHTTVRIEKERDRLAGAHARRHGYGTRAIAFYEFEENTIYAWAKELSESVLVHEMAHCIIDHYFRVRPPRRIEEMLAVHVDANLRE